MGERMEIKGGFILAFFGEYKEKGVTQGLAYGVNCYAYLLIRIVQTHLVVVNYF